MDGSINKNLILFFNVKHPASRLKPEEDAVQFPDCTLLTLSGSKLAVGPRKPLAFMMPMTYLSLDESKHPYPCRSGRSPGYSAV
jgi:hypothetical protein